MTLRCGRPRRLRADPGHVAVVVGFAGGAVDVDGSSRPAAASHRSARRRRRLADVAPVRTGSRVATIRHLRAGQLPEQVDVDAVRCREESGFRLGRGRRRGSGSVMQWRAADCGGTRDLLSAAGLLAAAAAGGMGARQGPTAAAAAGVRLAPSRRSSAGAARAARASRHAPLLVPRDRLRAPRALPASALLAFALPPPAAAVVVAAVLAALGLLPVTFRQGRRVAVLPHELAAGAQLVTHVHVIMRATFALRGRLAMDREVLLGLAVRQRRVGVPEAGAADPPEAGEEGLAEDDVDPGVEGLVEAGQAHGHQAEDRGMVVAGLKAEQDVGLKQPHRGRERD